MDHYLVPTTITVVDALPYTTNGKVDVRALPSPPGAPPSEAGERDDVEETVAAIWARILDVEADRIGPDTDFHSLGGDSLSMAEMLAAVSAELALWPGSQREQEPGDTT